MGIPIKLQDAPLSGVDLPVPLLVKMAQEIEMLKLFKNFNFAKEVVEDYVEAPLEVYKTWISDGNLLVGFVD